MLPIFYNRLGAVCSTDEELEIVGRHLAMAEKAFASTWDYCDRIPTAGPQWRAVTFLVADSIICVISARERPDIPQIVELRDVTVIRPPE